jgi:hypothetical protein
MFTPPRCQPTGITITSLRGDREAGAADLYAASPLSSRESSSTLEKSTHGSLGPRAGRHNVWREAPSPPPRDQT